MIISGVGNTLPPWLTKILFILITVAGILIIVHLDSIPQITWYAREYFPSESVPSMPIQSLYTDLKLPEVSQKKDKYFIVIGIPSAPNHVTQRAAIRRTWGNVSRWSALNEAEDQYKRVKVMFLFGQGSGARDLDNQEEFQKEKNEHDDMYVIPSLKEGRLSLRYKVVWALKESLSFEYDYFVKTDDDVFVNLPLMVMSLITSARERLYTGSCKHVYGGFGGYPRWMYCSGGGYVLSRDVVQEFQNLPQQVHEVPFRPEDGYTGWLVHNLKTLRGFNVKVFSQGLLRVHRYKCGPFNLTWFYHGVFAYQMERFFRDIDEDIFDECPDPP